MVLYDWNASVIGASVSSVEKEANFSFGVGKIRARALVVLNFSHRINEYKVSCGSEARWQQMSTLILRGHLSQAAHFEK
jgi:hypothetical protein